MPMWNSDSQLFKFMREELYSAVLGDIMDTHHLYHQFLPAKIQPLATTMIVAGRAMPVLETDTYGGNLDSYKELVDKPFGLMLEALDDLKEHEVYICTGSSPTYALWGELMSMRAKWLGAAGAVLDGYARDTNGIIELEFPTFSYGRYAQDQAPRGKVVDYRVPIEIEGVCIHPGDIIFGDLEGVLVIPRRLEQEIIEKALEKAKGEKTVGKAIRAGMTAKAAFEEYGIL